MSEIMGDEGKSYDVYPDEQPLLEQIKGVLIYKREEHWGELEQLACRETTQDELSIDKIQRIKDLEEIGKEVADKLGCYSCVCAFDVDRILQAKIKSIREGSDI